MVSFGPRRPALLVDAIRAAGGAGVTGGPAELSVVPFLRDGSVPPPLPDDGLDRVPGYGPMRFSAPWDRLRFAEEVVLAHHHPDTYTHRLHLLPPSLDPAYCVGPGCAGHVRWVCNPAAWALEVRAQDGQAAA